MMSQQTNVATEEQIIDNSIVVVYNQDPIKPLYEGFDPDIDYTEIMIECCLMGDIQGGQLAEIVRNRKIDELGLDEVKISFDDLYELSKIITAEAGSVWLPLEWKIMVGEVVLNRVESPEFADNIYDVIHQKGQYATANTQWFKELIPYQECVEAGVELLSGTRLINDKSVIFQANGKQGSGVCVTLYDNKLGYTYLCYSYRPEIYEN